MKKIFLYILAVLFIIIILPSICTKRRQDVAKKEDEKQEQNVAQVEKYDYSKYKDIRLFHSKTCTWDIPIIFATSLWVLSL